MKFMEYNILFANILYMEYIIYSRPQHCRIFVKEDDTGLSFIYQAFLAVAMASSFHPEIQKNITSSSPLKRQHSASWTYDIYEDIRYMYEDFWRN